MFGFQHYILGITWEYRSQVKENIHFNIYSIIQSNWNLLSTITTATQTKKVETAHLLTKHLNLSIFRTGSISYLFQEVGHLVIIPFKFDMR